jgi:hypothetical protein
LYKSATQILDKFRNGLYNFPVRNEDGDNDYENIATIDKISETPTSGNCNVQNIGSEMLDDEMGNISLTLSFWQTIEEDFEEVFFLGRREQMLEKIFKNSVWTRSLFKGEEMCFGKIYKESSHFYGATPDIVALAIPVLGEKVEKGLLGSFSSYVKLNNVNGDGFMVLLQDAESGRAIKIIKNKG